MDYIFKRVSGKCLFSSKGPSCEWEAGMMWEQDGHVGQGRTFSILFHDPSKCPLSLSVSVCLSLCLCLSQSCLLSQYWEMHHVPNILLHGLKSFLPWRSSLVVSCDLLWLVDGEAQMDRASRRQDWMGLSGYIVVWVKGGSFSQTAVGTKVIWWSCRWAGEKYRERSLGQCGKGFHKRPYSLYQTCSLFGREHNLTSFTIQNTWRLWGEGRGKCKIRCYKRESIKTNLWVRLYSL